MTIVVLSCAIALQAVGQAPQEINNSSQGDAITKWILLATALFIAWQAWETRRSARAAAKSVDSAERSIKLQEVALRQWVAIEKWRGLPYILENGTKTLHIEFDVVNPTKLPLTLHAISTTLDGQPNKVAGKNLLPPEHRHPVAVAVKITDQQLLGWEGEQWPGQKLVLPVTGMVIYEDVLEQTRTQPFGGMLVCSSKTGVELVTYHGGGLYLLEKGEKKS